MTSSISENVKPENYRFYKITQKAYVLGAVGHIIAGILFLCLKVPEMVWFNFIFSVPVFTFSLFINRTAMLKISVSKTALPMTLQSWK
jgi:sigma-B regulation protein RsbU (phosphoserine phosphatase)